MRSKKLSIGIVLWGNSDQNFKILSYFCSLLLITRCEEVSFGSSVDQSVLYLLMKESLKNHVLKRSYNQYGKSPIELIRITPFGVIQISQPTIRGNWDHSSKNDWHLFPHLITYLLFNIKWKKMISLESPRCLLWDLKISRWTNGPLLYNTHDTDTSIDKVKMNCG